MQPIFEEVDKVINGERQDVYGNPEDSFELIAKYWQTYLWSLPEDEEGYARHLTAHDVAIMMTLFKIARMSGQKPSRDNNRDAIGYLALDADRLSATGDISTSVETGEPTPAPFDPPFSCQKCGTNHYHCPSCAIPIDTSMRPSHWQPIEKED